MKTAEEKIIEILKGGIKRIAYKDSDYKELADKILEETKKGILDEIEKRDKAAVNILSGLKVVESNLVPEDTVIVSKKLNLKQKLI